MVSTDKAVAMTGFFDEVKARKVYRVAAAYIIAAGGIIQLASALFLRGNCQTGRCVW
jgi:hypothetical protein